ncbi:UNVERIFIED_CONTAM: hypothetical protein FKN15_032680 [Acipenser sinensis]
MTCCSTLIRHVNLLRNWCACSPSGLLQYADRHETGDQGSRSLKDRYSRFLLKPEGGFATDPRLCKGATSTSFAAKGKGRSLRLSHKQSSSSSNLLPQAQGPCSGTHLEYWRQCTTDTWVLNIVQTGYSLQFRHGLPPFSGLFQLNKTHSSDVSEASRLDGNSFTDPSFGSSACARSPSLVQQQGFSARIEPRPPADSVSSLSAGAILVDTACPPALRRSSGQHHQKGGYHHMRPASARAPCGMAEEHGVWKPPL